MNTKTTTAAVVVMNERAVALLRDATQHLVTADKAARDAAFIAYTEWPEGRPNAETYKAIVSAYMPELGNKTLRNAFSAAVALLCDTTGVTIDASAKIEKANGALSFTAPEFVPHNAVQNPEKARTTLNCAEAVQKLDAKALLSAATVARENLGVGSKSENKGGRPAKEEPAKRPCFADELSALLHTDAGRKALNELLGKAGYQLTPVERTTRAKRVPKGGIPTLAEQAASAAAA